MDLRIPSAELKRLIKKISPARSSVLVFDPENGQMIAADDVLGITVKHPAFTSSGNRTSVATKAFTSVIGSLSGEIHIKDAGTSLRVETGRAGFDIAKAPLKPFDVVSTPESYVNLPTEAFKKAIEFAVSVAEEKQSFDFTGFVLVDVVDGFLRVSGTDKRQMAFYQTKIAASDIQRILISARAAQAVKELSGETIRYGESNRMQVFTSYGVSVYARMIEETQHKKFPAVEQVLPRNILTEIQINAEELQESLHRVAAGVTNENPRVLFAFSGEELTVSAAAADVKVKDVIRIDTIKPDVFEDPIPLQITLNHDHVVRFADAVPKTGIITFKANSPRTPVLWEYEEYKLLGMPFA